MLLAIRAYQHALSPAMLPACRFEPTCSRYAYEAIERHGALTGLRLAVHRLWRCRPGVTGGYDPVPSHTANQISLVAAAVAPTTASAAMSTDRSTTSPTIAPTTAHRPVEHTAVR